MLFLLRPHFLQLVSQHFDLAGTHLWAGCPEGSEVVLDLVRFVLQRHHDLAVVSAGRYGVLTMALRQVANAIGRAANVSEVQSVLELGAYGVAGYAESRAEANARDGRESI